MTERYPLLEQLRAERERADAEVAAPFVDHITRLANVNSRLREENHQYSRFLTHGMEKRMLQAIRHSAADQFAPMLMEALRSHSGVTVTVTISPNDVRFLMPDQVERAVLEKARQLIGEQILATVPHRPLTAERVHATVVRFHIPALTVEVPVASAYQPHTRNSDD